MDYIEVHSEFDQAVDGLLYQKINEDNWFFTFDNQTLTINNFDGTISKTVPFQGNIFNQTGVYNSTTKAPINFGNGYKNTLIHYPYVF